MARAPLKLVADWCRALGSPLRAGLTIKETLALSAKKGDGRLRSWSQAVLDRVNDGDDLAAAFKAVPVELPPLFMAMAQVGTKTGRFPEILRQLEDYFRFQLQLKREFLQRIFWPAFQLIAAIFIIALVIFILGLLATGPSGKPAFDPLGFGLFGPVGAMIWLFLCFGSMACIAFVIWAAKNLWHQEDALDSFALRIPALGPCLHTLAMARLCMGMSMTMDSSLSLKKSIPLSLEATDNGAFKRLIPKITDSVVKERNSLYESFSEHRLFPEEFLHVLATAEEAGSVPEEMGRLSGHFNEQAKLRMALLNQAAGWAVWGLVATLVIFLIFRMALSYIGILNNAINNPMGV